jgi:hypothetical protein
MTGFDETWYEHNAIGGLPTFRPFQFSVQYSEGARIAGGIAAGYRVRFLAEARGFFFILHGFRVGFGAHPASCPVSTLGESGQGMKLTTHSHLVLRSRMVELYLHSSFVFMAWCLIKHMDFTFFLTFTQYSD